MKDLVGGLGKLAVEVVGLLLVVLGEFQFLGLEKEHLVGRDLCIRDIAHQRILEVRHPHVLQR